MKLICSIAVLVLLGVACLASSGCRTFNWTEEDEARERKRYRDGSENAPLRGLLSVPSYF